MEIKSSFPLDILGTERNKGAQLFDGHTSNTHTVLSVIGVLGVLFNFNSRSLLLLSARFKVSGGATVLHKRKANRISLHVWTRL